jgi:hypothetical protein
VVLRHPLAMRRARPQGFVSSLRQLPRRTRRHQRGHVSKELCQALGVDGSIPPQGSTNPCDPACGSPGGPSAADGFEGRFAGQPEGAPVHRHHHPGADILGRLDGPVRVQVHGLYEPARRLRTNGHHRDVDPRISESRSRRRRGRRRGRQGDRSADHLPRLRTKPPHRVAQWSNSPAVQWCAGTNVTLQLAHPDRLTPSPARYVSATQPRPPGGFNRVERRSREAKRCQTASANSPIVAILDPSFSRTWPAARPDSWSRPRRWPQPGF